MSDLPLHEQVGFDYVAAVRELLERVTYQELAFSIGYESVGSISGLLKGRKPSHIQGEALWAFYLATFGRKPPLMRNIACAPSTASV